MKKIFISQPMRGKSEHQIKAERALAVSEAAEFTQEEVEVIDSYFSEEYTRALKLNESKNVPLKYLALSLSLLAEADLAVFAAGWNEARGCLIEHEAALAYGIKTLELDAHN